LTPKGNCNVCEDAINEVEKILENNHKKRNTDNVALDMKLMIEAYEKLCKGISIDPKVGSSLLLSGVINIINQYDDLAHFEEKLKSTELDNTTSKIRIESLENCVLKQDDRIRKLEETVSLRDKKEEDKNKNKQIDALLEKVYILETDLNKMQQGNSKCVDENAIKCNLCGLTFSRNCDLEMHVENEHENAKKHECDVCGKTFVLKWRMKKHMEGHSDVPSFCHYYNNNKPCPYELIGCMFQHKNSELSVVFLNFVIFLLMTRGGSGENYWVFNHYIDMKNRDL
jgi:hypothetical protein